MTRGSGLDDRVPLVTSAPGLALVPCHPHATSARLAEWRANVGTPVAYDPPARDPGDGPPDLRSLVVLSWNVWIGRGRLAELIELVRAAAFASLGAQASFPLVVLVQEALRADDSVPLRSNGMAARERPSLLLARDDVVETAR